MQIAVASGKGGTGKTTIATNLAYAASISGLVTSYLDCDVEEPNGHLFLKPEITGSRKVAELKPEIDPELCTHCGLCERICRFNALVCLEKEVLVFPEICHSCGGCALVCPSKAISEVPREIGRVESGKSGKINFAGGLLNIGETMSPPVIREVKKCFPEAELRIVDSPPGTSCPVIESVRGSDYVVLVTEPTPFGLNDLKLAVELLEKLGIPFGVVINRVGIGTQETWQYCENREIDILLEIPEDRYVAECYSRGELMSLKSAEYGAGFTGLLKTLLGKVANPA